MMITDVPHLTLLGVSFRTADAAVREALAFNRDEAAALLSRAAASVPELEALVLSTCNRTECYVVGEEAAAHVYQVIRSIRPEARVLDVEVGRYRFHGEAAFRHLVRVACGLDSAILGDTQILGQLRGAIRIAEEAGTFGRYLSRATGAALRAGKQARRDTSIGKGAPGIGPAVAATLGQRRPPGTGAAGDIVVVGAGDAARAVGRALVKSGQRNLVVCNRSPEGADRLVSELGAGAVTRPWTELGDALIQASAVVVATSAPGPVLRADLLAGRAGDARRVPLVVIDAGFPPQVDPGVAELHDVELVPLDAIRSGEDAVAAERRAAVPAVEQIVEGEVDAWRTWRAGLPLEMAIRALHEEAAALTREAAAELAAVGALSAGDAERILRPTVRRLLHDHVTRLRALPQPAERPGGSDFSEEAV